LKKEVQNLVYIAVSSTLISIFSQLIIPLPSGVPLTLQTFMIALIGCIFGSARGVISVLVYIAVGAVGAPVFTGFQGGLGALFGVTGGFIIGFIPLAFMCGINTKSRFLKVFFAIIGVILCHLLGVLRFADYSGDFRSAFYAASLPYIAKDIVSAAAALVISGKIKRAISAYIT